MSGSITMLRFNANQDCFSVALNNGLRVFNSDPLVEKLSLSESLVGGLKCAELLHRTNLIAMVGGGARARFAENTVLVYDDLKKCFIWEVTFQTAVLSVRLSHSRLVAVTERQVHVFSFPSRIERLCTMDTRDNPRALCQLSTDTLQHSAQFVCFPGRKTGSVQLVDLKHMTKETSVSPVTINAHNSDIACIALNNQGTLLATGSVTGTVIRVFDTKSRQLLSEFRRGSDPAVLYCITFSPCSSYLCVSSDKGTVHIFAVKDKTSNRKTLLQQVGIVTEEAVRSSCQFSLPADTPPAVCAFAPSGNSVIALCMDGTYHKFGFAPSGEGGAAGGTGGGAGSCNREAFDYFLDLGDDEQFWTPPTG